MKIRFGSKKLKTNKVLAPSFPLKSKVHDNGGNATTCSGDVANFHNSHEINPDEIKKFMKIRKYLILVIYNFK